VFCTESHPFIPDFGYQGEVGRTKNRMPLGMIYFSMGKSLDRKYSRESAIGTALLTTHHSIVPAFYHSVYQAPRHPLSGMKVNNGTDLKNPGKPYICSKNGPVTTNRLGRLKE
jgi:hypothetical protein